jgi:hypothetical protein
MSIDHNQNQEQSLTPPDDSIDSVIECLQHPSAVVRIGAAVDLGRLGFKAQAASVPVKKLMLATNDLREHLILRMVLVAICPEAEKVRYDLPSISRELESTWAYARTLSVADAKDAVKNLIQSFKDSASPSNGSTEQAMMMVAIAATRPEIIPDLIQAFRAHTAYRGQLGFVLSLVALTRQEAAQQFLELLADEDCEVAEALALTSEA